MAQLHGERGLWLSESRESWPLRGDRGARCRDATPFIGDINAIGVVNPPTPALPSLFMCGLSNLERGPYTSRGQVVVRARGRKRDGSIPVS